MLYKNWASVLTVEEEFCSILHTYLIKCTSNVVIVGDIKHDVCVGERIDRNIEICCCGWNPVHITNNWCKNLVSYKTKSIIEEIFTNHKHITLCEDCLIVKFKGDVADKSSDINTIRHKLIYTYIQKLLHRCKNINKINYLILWWFLSFLHSGLTQIQGVVVLL